MEAELRSLLDGLHLLKDFGLEVYPLTIESDSQIQHSYRESNTVADSLATIGVQNRASVTYSSSATLPIQTKQLLWQDQRQIRSLRSTVKASRHLNLDLIQKKRRGVLSIQHAYRAKIFMLIHPMSTQVEEEFVEALLFSSLLEEDGSSIADFNLEHQLDIHLLCLEFWGRGFLHFALRHFSEDHLQVSRGSFAKVFPVS
ncbi:unnamed protein product [Ilex paraguariensis]|uniref:RNase H type-1 domain-containing protein n=1 Tax=Ilex paraguariensis TaxID=185542 RepID=A0ABC8QY41_9AQUA